MEIIKQHIPNWTRFCISYSPGIEFIKAFETRLSLISGLPEFNDIAKRINVELGILMLRHNEIDTETMQALVGGLIGIKDEKKISHEPLFDERVFHKDDSSSKI